eukprot:s47_g19.t1
MSSSQSPEYNWFQPGPLSCTDEDGDDVASPRQDEQVTFAGYGGTAEDAEMIARLRLLESLQRWEMPSASQCLAIKLERQLQNRALELLCACRDPELDLDALVPEETYADCTGCVKGLVDALDEVLQRNAGKRVVSVCLASSRPAIRAVITAAGRAAGRCWQGPGRRSFPCERLMTWRSCTSCSVLCACPGHGAVER